MLHDARSALANIKTPALDFVQDLHSAFRRSFTEVLLEQMAGFFVIFWSKDRYAVSEKEAMRRARLELIDRIHSKTYGQIGSSLSLSVDKGLALHKDKILERFAGARAVILSECIERWERGNADLIAAERAQPEKNHLENFAMANIRLAEITLQIKEAAALEAVRARLS